MSNTDIWDKLCRVPKEHLKGFKRGGGFSGTAIKPMWSFHKMTEVFGPVGQFWRMEQPQFQVVQGDNREVLVFCTVGVLAGGQAFYGVGGDKVVKYIAANEQYNRPERWENDDEAFKKAYTDALTNALKLLGVGADVHMGLWDGNKYVDEKPEAKPQASEPPPQRHDMDAAMGTPGASKAGNRAAYDRLVKQIRDTPTVKMLKDWFKANITEINELPADWLDELRVEYADRQSELTKVVAA